MPRQANGTVFEKPPGSRRYYGRFTTTRGRKTIRLVTCTTAEQAEARKNFVAVELERLRTAGQEEHADKLLELSAVTDNSRLMRIRKGVDAIIAGEAQPVQQPTPLTDGGPTFREFAEQWTDGELHTRFPDHVKRKKTANDDKCRLESHVYPIVGEVPLRLFKVEDAERVMAKLDPTLSVGSRRQVAQLLHRVLALAAYPARVIEASPIPEGFLPKPSASKAQAWLYPAEEASLLRCVEVPLLYRLLYGFLTREGMRRDEALSLTWNDVDLERGTVTLDSNKTDDPRSWVLGADVCRALKVWRARYVPVVETGARVFLHEQWPLDGEHLAATLRVHLQKAGGVRSIVFQRTQHRAPIRAHDLRATFVTLALASEKSETWVCDRTGHRSSQMVNKYRRAARAATELRLGWLVPLDEGIPELAVEQPLVPVQSTGPVPTLNGACANTITQRAARDHLVVGLTDALRELIIAGDHEGANVAIDALRKLVEGRYLSSQSPDGASSQSPDGAASRCATSQRVCYR